MRFSGSAGHKLSIQSFSPALLEVGAVGLPKRAGLGGIPELTRQEQETTLLLSWAAGFDSGPVDFSAGVASCTNDPLTFRPNFVISGEVSADRKF